MTTDVPQWRPLSDARSIIGVACVWLSPYHAAVEALDAALQSGQVQVRGSSLSRPLQQPIESYLSGASLELAYVDVNKLGGFRGKDRLDFWNVEIDQTSLTRYIRERLAPASAWPNQPEAAPRAQDEPRSAAATVPSRWRDKFKMPQLDDELAPTPKRGRKPMRDEIYAALDKLRESEPAWQFNHAKEDRKKIENLGRKVWAYSTFCRHRASWKEDNSI